MKDTDLIYSMFVTLDAPGLSADCLRALGEPFDIHETNLRSILSRMHKKRIITVVKEGKRAFYSLSPHGREIGSNVSMHFHRPDWSGWDGEYWGAAFSVPDNRLRYRIQRKLFSYRFRALYPGLWIRPRREAESIPRILQDYIHTDGFDLFTCSFSGDLSPERVAEIYGLEDIRAGLRAAIGLAEASLGRIDSMDDRAVFVEYLRTGDALVKGLFRDPLLPPILLPGDWEGDRLRSAFSVWEKACRIKSAPFVERVLNTSIQGG